jgi:NADPH2:quinone reductase
MEIAILAQKGSLFATRPLLNHYIATRQQLLASAQDLFDVIDKGHVKIEINQTYPIVEAAQAHRDLAARKTTGSTVIEISRQG